MRELVLMMKHRRGDYSPQQFLTHFQISRVVFESFQHTQMIILALKGMLITRFDH
jgi:hypothetical protein